MNKYQINEVAIASLKKYFKDSTDIEHDYVARKDLTVEEVFKIVDLEIQKHESKIAELKKMRKTIEQSAKEVFNTNTNNDETDGSNYEKLTNKFNDKNFEYVNSLKEKIK